MNLRVIIGSTIRLALLPLLHVRCRSAFVEREWVRRFRNVPPSVYGGTGRRIDGLYDAAPSQPSTEVPRQRRLPSLDAAHPLEIRRRTQCVQLCHYHTGMDKTSLDTSSGSLFCKGLNHSLTHYGCLRHVERNYVPLFGVAQASADLRYYVIRDVIVI